MAEDRLRYVEIGVNAVVTKPFTREALQTAIANLLLTPQASGV